MSVDKQRQQILDVAATHATIETACTLLYEAETKMRQMRATGVPVSNAQLSQLSKALRESQIARDQALNFLRRMP